MQASSARWHRVEFPRGDRTLVEVAGWTIALFRVGDVVHAVENACPHEGNPLIDGDLLGRTLVCAYHSWRFDLETGACLAGERPLRRFPVRTRDGDVWVQLPG